MFNKQAKLFVMFTQEEQSYSYVIKGTKSKNFLVILPFFVHKFVKEKRRNYHHITNSINIPKNWSTAGLQTNGELWKKVGRFSGLAFQASYLGFSEFRLFSSTIRNFYNKFDISANSVFGWLALKMPQYSSTLPFQWQTQPSIFVSWLEPNKACSQAKLIEIN